MKLLGRIPTAGDSGSVQLVAEESECSVLDQKSTVCRLQVV